MHYRTAYNGYACAFSPFHENRIAVATAQNFGIIGNGRQHVLEVGAGCSVFPIPPAACAS
jgi:peroxin-7